MDALQYSPCMIITPSMDGGFVVTYATLKGLAVPQFIAGAYSNIEDLIESMNGHLMTSPFPARHSRRPLLVTRQPDPATVSHDLPEPEKLVLDERAFLGDPMETVSAPSHLRPSSHVQSRRSLAPMTACTPASSPSPAASCRCSRMPTSTPKMANSGLHDH